MMRTWRRAIAAIAVLTAVGTGTSAGTGQTASQTVAPAADLQGKRRNLGRGQLPRFQPLKERMALDRVAREKVFGGSLEVLESGHAGAP